MSFFRVKLAVTTVREVEVYAPDHNFAIDRAIEQAERRYNAIKVKLVYVDLVLPKDLIAPQAQ